MVYEYSWVMAGLRPSAVVFSPTFTETAKLACAGQHDGARQSQFLLALAELEVGVRAAAAPESLYLLYGAKCRKWSGILSSFSIFRLHTLSGTERWHCPERIE